MKHLMSLIGVLLFSGSIWAGYDAPNDRSLESLAISKAHAELAEIRSVFKDCMETDKSGQSCGDKAKTRCQKKMDTAQCDKLVSKVKQEMHVE